jgi:hypothetical protein
MVAGIPKDNVITVLLDAQLPSSAAMEDALVGPTQSG